MSEKGFSEFIVAPPRSWIGVGGTFGLSVLSGLLTGIVQIALNNSAVYLLLVAISIALFIGGLYLLQRRWPKKVELKVLATPEMLPQKKKGLIILVGPGRPGEDPSKQAANPAVEFHRLNPDGSPCLRVCWIITSQGEGGGLPFAQELQKQYQDKGVRVIIHAVADAFSVKETADFVEKIYKEEITQEGLNVNDVVADFTGATKPMTAGMVLACGAERPMQYVFGRKQGIASVPVAIRY